MASSEERVGVGLDYVPDDSLVLRIECCCECEGVFGRHCKMCASTESHDGLGMSCFGALGGAEDIVGLDEISGLMNMLDFHKIAAGQFSNSGANLRDDLCHFGSAWIAWRAANRFNEFRLSNDRAIRSHIFGKPLKDVAMPVFEMIGLFAVPQLMMLHVEFKRSNLNPVDRSHSDPPNNL